MNIRIALAGNPNCGKTTLFNALTGSNQFVGNWPGVTVEKKEGKLKKHDNVTITDLPGIYSLSPYTLEEVVARKYLLDEHPDVILNIIDGTNLERNLYLTTQLTELGIPVVIAINMIDIINKNGDKINIKALGATFKCPIVEISALKGIGVMDAAEIAIKAAKNKSNPIEHRFSPRVEHAIDKIENIALRSIFEINKRWYAIKIFERDSMTIKQLNLSDDVLRDIEKELSTIEADMDDDTESIITNERYLYISSILKGCYKKKAAGHLSVSDKIDKVVTNRWAALPIFAAIMFLVYFISVTTVGDWATNWANDGVFGDGWHLFGIGSKAYDKAIAEYAKENAWTDKFMTTVDQAVDADVVGAEDIRDAIEAENYGAFDEAYGLYADSLSASGFELSEIYDAAFGDDVEGVPDAADYGVWVPGIPVLVEEVLEAISCADWLSSLILDGIIGGVGAVLGFVPQMIVLFILLAFLESCGYMARIAFVLDRVFRKFGLSGKSFIPMLIGTGCGVPGIMASRTIENERDRRMTIMTTTFIPCGAKLPIIGLIASALFGNSWWVAPSAYFIGIAAIVISGIMLKKTKMFAGNPAPFVMELPAYHMPRFVDIIKSMWERTSSFIKRAGTVIVAASLIIWVGSMFGMMNGRFCFSLDMELDNSVLGMISNVIGWVFKPLGFGNVQTTVATIMGLVAKEEVVGVLGVLDFEGMTQLSAYSFLIFNLLCAPCFAAMGAIKREMNNSKWTAFAIGYQCVFAYAISLIVYQFGSLFLGEYSIIGLIAAALVLGFILYMLFIKKYSEAAILTKRVKINR